MYRLLLAVLLILAGRVVAEELRFPDQNFRIEVPAGWEVAHLPDTLLVLRNQQGNQTIQISAARLIQQERDSGASIAQAKIKKRYEELGITIDSEGGATVNYVPYRTLTGHSAEPRSFQVYITSANGTLYTFEYIADTAYPARGPSLQAVLKSFKLIRFWAFTADPPATPVPTPEPESRAKLLLAMLGPPLLVAILLYAMPILAVSSLGVVLYFLLRQKS